MKKFLVIFLLTLFITPLCAESEYEYMANDLINLSRDICVENGGTFTNNDCVMPSKPEAFVKNKTIDNQFDGIYLNAIQSFENLCQKEYKAKIEKEKIRAVGPRSAGLSVTCWFPDLKAQSNPNKTSKQDIEQLKRCANLNKQLNGGNIQVSYHSREKTIGADAERGCYIFAPYKIDNSQASTK